MNHLVQTLKSLALFFLLLTAAAAAERLAQGSTQEQHAELFFKFPQFTAPAVSPDGNSVGFIAQTEGRAGLFKMDRATGQMETLFTAGEGEIAAFWWLGNQRVLLAARGVRNIEYFVQELNGSKPRPIHALDWRDPSSIIVFASDPDHAISLNKRVDLNSGHSSPMDSTTGDYGFVYSSKGELRAKLGQAMGKWRISWRARADVPWHTLESSNEDWPPFTVAGMAEDDRHLWVYANDQGNTEAVMLLDPETDQRTLVAQRPDHDVYGLVWQAPRVAPTGVAFYDNGKEDLVFFDDSSKHLAAILDRSLPGMLHRVTSSSTDGVVRIIAAWLPGYPAHYYLFDGAKHQLSVLGEQHPEIAAGGLGEVHYFSFTTRDGLAESGFVLLPKKTNGAKPAPLLVMAMQSVGEQASSANDFHAQDQFFVSRGFAVAHFVVRGNIGFGRKLQRAGDFHLADKIVQDEEDGVAFLAREDLIDPQRVAIMGYGLGGLAALHTAAVSKTFHAVVAYSPECDLTANSVGWLSSSTAELPTIVKQAGGTKAAYDLVHQFEPESFIEKLSAPALLAYSSQFGFTSSLLEAMQIRGSFDRHHKTYEWYQLDFDASDHVKIEVYLAKFYVKVADYLEKTLK